MSTAQISAKTIFLQALEHAAVAEREAYLDTQCGTDADLRREVEQLLRHHGEAGNFLESPPTVVVESAEQLHTIAPPPSLGFLTPSSRADSLGRLGHYEILEVVGSGGMGVVLKAFDERLQRIVAIKAMAPALAASGTGRERFAREAQAAAAVNHDNVVDIYAVDKASPVPYLVMEFIAGISLEDKLQRQGPLELKEILRIGLQTAEGLAAAHRQGLVHRDVKPANILLENGVERVKITDFGLARAADDVSITQTGVIAGTPAFMSPEQARGDAVDQRSDLFSLGSVLYSLCAGQSPFRGSTSLGVLRRVCEEQPQPIRDLNPDIPEWLCAVIDKLHAKLPGERFQSAAELAEVLGRYLAHVQQPSLPLPSAIVPLPGRAGGVSLPVTHKQPKSVVRRSRKRAWAVAAITAVVILGVTLSLTDAGGITHVTASVIRVFTPEGTLLVETDDPRVKVTVEGDGGLVITGAGPQEVRLKPGSYRVQAARDGKPVPVDQELVTISRGDRRIVRVRVEGLGSRPRESVPETVQKISGFRPLVGHKVAVHDMAYTPDGRQAVSIGGDGTLRVWDLAEKREVKQIVRDPQAMCRGLSMSPDGKSIAIGGEQGLVFVFDLASGEETLKLTVAQKAVAATRFSPDSLRLITGTSGSGIQLWDLQTGKEIRRFEGHRGGRNYDLVFSRNGTHLLSAGGDHTARLWAVETGQEIRRFQGHSDEIYSAAFSPDGTQVATSSVDTTIRIWDVESGRTQHILKGHTHTVKRVRWLPDGRHLVSGADDKTIRFWNVAASRQVAWITTDTHVTSRFAVAPDGSALLSGGGYAWDFDARRLRYDGDTDIRIWDLSKLLISAPVATAPAHDIWKRGHGGIMEIALSGDGQRGVACAGHDVFLFDPDSGQELGRFQGHGDHVRSVAFSPDGKLVASGGHDATVRLWDPKTRQEIRRFATERIVDKGRGRPFSYLAFSPDGTQLLAGSRNDLLLWNVESGELVRRFAGHTGAPRRVAFSFDGELVASCGHDGTARLWRTKTAELVQTVTEGSNWIVDLDFSPDRKTFATGGRVVTVWDIATGKPLWRYPIEPRWAEGMAFTPDGRFLLAAIGNFTLQQEGELIIFDARTGSEVHRSAGLTDYIFDLKPTSDGRGVFIGESGEMRLRRLPESLWPALPKEDTAGKSSVQEPAPATIGGRIVTPRLVLAGHTSWVESVAFSPDGKRLATGSDDQHVHIWDVATGETRGKFHADDGLITSLDYSPDGSQLATASDRSNVRLWNAATFERLAEVKHNSLARAVAFRRSDSLLATASFDKSVKLWQWDGKDLAAVRNLAEHSDVINAISFNPQGTVIASATGDGVLSLWDLKSGELKKAVALGRQPLRCLAFSPDGMTIAVSGDKKQVELRNVDTLESVGTLQGHEEIIHALAFLPDGTLVVAGGPWHFHRGSATPEPPGELKFWGIAERKLRLSVSGYPTTVRCLAVSRDGKLLAAGDFASLTRVWDVEMLLAAASAAEPAAVASPSDVRKKLNLRLARANAYNDEATVLLRSKRLIDAELAVRAGLDLKRSLTVEFPDNSEYQFHLAHSYLGLGHVVAEGGRQSEAALAYTEAGNLLAPLAADGSSSADFRQWNAHALWQLGDAWLRLDRCDEGQQAYELALVTFQQLAEANPANLFYRQEQGYSQRLLANAAEQAGRSEVSLSRLNEAVVLYQQLVADAPDSTSYLESLAFIQLKLVERLARAGQFALAERTFGQADASYTDLLAKPPAPLSAANVADGMNNVAWRLVMRPDTTAAAVQLTKTIVQRAEELTPSVGHIWSTRAMTHYRAGEWEEALAAHVKASNLGFQSDVSLLFAAMTHSQLGNRGQAQQQLDAAVQRANKNQPVSEEVTQLLAEVDLLLKDKSQAKDNNSNESKPP